MMRGLVGALLLVAGCFRPMFELRGSERTALEHNGGRFSDGRVMDRTGALRLVRGARKSPYVYARALVVGAEGVCLASTYDVGRFWSGLRLAHVDPRIESMVFPAAAGITILRLADLRWEIRGDNEALRRWVPRHMGEREKALRSFIDVPPIVYSVKTSIGWNTVDRSVLERHARPPGWFDDSVAFVGWRWTDFDRVEYFDFWPDSEPTEREIARAIDEHEHVVRTAIENAEGLPPGPCPLRGRSTPLLAR